MNMAFELSIMFVVALILVGLVLIGINYSEAIQCDNYKEAGFETTIKEVVFTQKCWVKDGNVYYPREQIRGGLK